MDEDPRRTVAELAKGMEAAGALIESLEEEAANLRRGLERATAILRTAQVEVTSSAGMLEEGERARARAQRELEALRAENSDLKRRHSDKQLRLSNEHTNELAAVRRRLEEQRRLDVEAASSETSLDDLKEEFRREREALEIRHHGEVETLKQSSEQWEERLRIGYRVQEERHASELEAVRREAEDRRAGTLARRERRAEGREEKSASAEVQEATLRALRDAEAGRELELQKSYRAVIETHQAEIKSLREELEAACREAEELPRKELREVKAFAESRERELRKRHESRLADVKGGCRTQGRGDTGPAGGGQPGAAGPPRGGDRAATARVRAAPRPRRRAHKVRDLGDRGTGGGVKIRRDAELRTSTARFKELESARLAQRFPPRKDLERVVRQFGAEISTYENHVADLQEALQESETHREDLERQLAALSSGPAGSESPNGLPDQERATQDEPAEALRGIETERILAKERIQDLEVQLREARQGSRRTAEHLESVLESLNRLSDPERRLREGISLFNASKHARTVASISKALGLPLVHAGLDEGTPGRPTLTFLWGDTWLGAATSPIRRRISISLRSISPGPATYPPRSTSRAANPTPAWTPGGG